MSTFTRLDRVLNASDEILIDDTSRLVFLSDCHRGDNSKADDFASNSSIYCYALEYYYKRGYTYVEIGDGDELWENDYFSSLLQAHGNVYLQMRKFHQEGRLYMIWGNHDIFKSRSRYVKKNLYEYYDPVTQKSEPLFDNIKVHEGLILRYRDTNHKILIVHGHQGDLLNDCLWPLSRFLVRYIWRHFELLRCRNPISPARNASRTNTIESNIIRWIKANNQIVIAGHTHHAAFARPGEAPYFNDGCCVNNDYITGIEIQNGEIMLVEWYKKLSDRGLPEISRKISAGPEKINAFFLHDS